jgi:hypothetical protein
MCKNIYKSVLKEFLNNFLIEITYRVFPNEPLASWANSKYFESILQYSANVIIFLIL